MEICSHLLVKASLQNKLSWNKTLFVSLLLFDLYFLKSKYGTKWFPFKKKNCWNDLSRTWSPSLLLRQGFSASALKEQTGPDCQIFCGCKLWMGRVLQITFVFFCQASVGMRSEWQMRIFSIHRSLSIGKPSKKTGQFGTIDPNLWNTPTHTLNFIDLRLYLEFTGNFRQKRGQICHKNSDL